jgi:hypothetical protein
MRNEYTFEDMLKMDTASLYAIATETAFLVYARFSPREIEMAQALIAMGSE